MSHSSSSTASQCVYDIPLAFEEGTTRIRGFEPQGAQSRHWRFVEESRKWTVGPMPVADFMRYFLASRQFISVKDMLPSRSAFKSVPARAATPTEIYEPLLAALNKAENQESRCPGFVFDNASARSPHPRRLGYTTPHLCLYRRDHLELVQSSQSQSRTEIGYSELFIEVTADPTLDYFTDPPNDATDEARLSHDFVTHSDDARSTTFMDRALGQHISYVTEIFARQHRHFLFSVAMFGSRARLFRWDRIGCIVTESFDIRAQPEVLCDFLWRFSHASDGRRGHDLTVQVASSEDEAVFAECIKAHVQLQLGAKAEGLEEAVSAHYVSGHVSAVHVLQQGSIARADTIRRYLVSRPVISPLSLVGKGTRGFWAVDSSTREVLFLKDTWRTLELEGHTLQRMSAEGVRNIPPVARHGEVPDYLPREERKFEAHEFQATLTDEFCSDPWTCVLLGSKYSLSKRTHYRLVLGIVGYTLRQITGTQELLRASYDVLQAMSDARIKDYRLHRDISIGNVILVAESGRDVRRGYLIDWDASCDVNDTGASIYEGRAGTWEFMSIAMLDRSAPTRRQTLEDDLESLFYVVLYCAFLWLPHNLSESDLAETMTAVFDFRDSIEGEIYGGKGKVMNRYMRVYTRHVAFGPALKQWIDGIMDLLRPPLRRTYRPPRKSADVGKDDDRDKALAERSKASPGADEGASKPAPAWNMENVERFWAEFLRTHALDKDDRVVHPHPRATGILYSDKSTASFPSYGCTPLRKSPPAQRTEDIASGVHTPIKTPSPLALPATPPPFNVHTAAKLKNCRAA
ncbi:hypothetical protein OH76DRAFT_1488529 [Lentinus brumalis]|uniref:Fungal-type protein kinase domain-containing protein n=1 Tax=Lentinus brumalis TaxID=2498619 RepID=A0A371CQU2_9APHY|nr:hypothetical protein OH76DRAFT_1488529 [Polyporus brumalis]